jgi:hypothetical protein
MKLYHGNDHVEPGIYFNLAELRFRSMEDEGTLPGAPTEVWRRVPAIALLVVGPVLGGIFAIFLPLVGFFLLASLLFKAVAHLAGELAVASLRVLKPAWQPARAFLSRSRPARREGGDEWSEEVERELAAGEEKDAGEKDPQE